MSNITTPPISPEGEILAMPAKEAGESNFRYIERLMEGLMVPGDDAGDELLGKLLGSASLSEQNAVWDSESSLKLIGRQFIFHGFKVRPSTKPDGFHYMLVCSVEDPRTGQQDVLTTGAQSMIAQLLGAYFQGALPALAEIRGPKTAREDGKTPIRLEWLGKV